MAISQWSTIKSHTRMQVQAKLKPVYWKMQGILNNCKMKTKICSNHVNAIYHRGGTNFPINCLDRLFLHRFFFSNAYFNVISFSLRTKFSCAISRAWYWWTKSLLSARLGMQIGQKASKSLKNQRDRTSNWSKMPFNRKLFFV